MGGAAGHIVAQVRNLDYHAPMPTSAPETPAAPPAVRDPDHYRLHAELCKVLTEPKRLLLLDSLRAGPRSVGELAAIAGIALPNASQHLSVLRAAGLVDGRRSGTTVFYELSEPDIAQACDIIDRIVARRLPRSLEPDEIASPGA
jgi:DNA-binding transcriptional ArsR family regulator